MCVLGMEEVYVLGERVSKLSKIKCTLKSVSSLKGSDCIESIDICLKSENT